MKNKIHFVLASCLLISSLSAQTVIFSDNFDSPDHLDARQSQGELRGSYIMVAPAQHSFVDGKLQRGRGIGGVGIMQLDLELVDHLPSDRPFAIEFELLMRSESGHWHSVELLSANEDERKLSPISFFLRDRASSTKAVSVNFGRHGDIKTKSFSGKQLSERLGQTWDPTTPHRFRLLVKPDSPTSGRYDLLISGIAVAENLNYAYSDSESRRLGFSAIADTKTILDDLKITIEPRR